MSGACEYCWDEAFKRARATGGHQAEIYHYLVAESWCFTTGARIEEVNQ